METAKPRENFSTTPLLQLPLMGWNPLVLREVFCTLCKQIWTFPILTTSKYKMTYLLYTLLFWAPFILDPYNFRPPFPNSALLIFD